MADLTGHAAGNGGHSQGTPTAHRALLYSDIDQNRVSQDLTRSRAILVAIRKLAFWSSDVPNF
jgi:hypothetical protein